MKTENQNLMNELLDSAMSNRDNGHISKHESGDRSRQVSLEMENLTDEFGVYLFREGIAKTTTRKYLKDIKQFFKEKGISHVDEINRESINDWILTLRSKKNPKTGKEICVGTIAAHLWAIRKFLSFIKEEKRLLCYEWDIRIPKVPSPEVVEFLEMSELEKLFSFLDNSKIHDVRLRAFIELMINTGMRPSETLGLKRDDLKEQPKEIEIIGKGKKKRPIYFNERAYYWLDLYLSKRTDKHPALFVIHNGKQTTRTWDLRGAEYSFQQLIKKMDFGERKIVPHTFRHTFATLRMANGCPPDYIARILGHSKVEITRKYYLAATKKHAKEAYERYDPFSSGHSYEINSKLPSQLLPSLN